MKIGLRLFQLPFLALCLIGFIGVLSSCSKKDVRQDEPVISPTGGDLGGGTAGGGEVESSHTNADSGELQTAYFDFDSYRINGESRTALKANADWLKANPKAEIQVEGHCDERGTVEYNLALGERRAAAVRSYLQKLGIAKKRISTISYGKERPLDPGHDESAWSKNRRASFVITSR